MSQTKIIFLMCLITLPLASVNSSFAKSLKSHFVKGPVSAKLVRVIDGDTVLVDAEPWPAQTIRVYVRLRDIDTPELKSKCSSLRATAKQAKSALMGMLIGQKISLHNISGGKYYGRILADIETDHGLNPGGELLQMGLAVPYKSRKLNRICKSS